MSSILFVINFSVKKKQGVIADGRFPPSNRSKPHPSHAASRTSHWYRVIPSTVWAGGVPGEVPSNPTGRETATEPFTVRRGNTGMEGEGAGENCAGTGSVSL